MNYGILDFGSIEQGSNAISTIHQSIELAQIADKMGFSRYWLAEHHEDGLAWKSPEIVLTLIAGYTENIRLGPAGVLMALNSPLKVAQTYKLLDNLYSSRIDLGLAKGSASIEKCLELLDGGDFQTNFNQYYKRVSKVTAFMKDADPQHIIPPLNGSVPEIWILAASGSSIDYVVKEEANFSLSLFHQLNQLPSALIIEQLKEKFYQQHKRFPVFNVAISAICSKDRKQVEEVAAQTKNFKINFGGTPDDFIIYLEHIRQLYQTNEIIVYNLGRNMDEKMMLLESLETRIDKSVFAT